MTTTNALYIVNLIESNLNARQGKTINWSPSFDDVVAKSEANTPRPKTFGQRKAELLEFANEPFFLAAYKAIDDPDLMTARNLYAHDQKYRTHGVTSDQVAVLEALATVKVGADFSPLPDFLAIERAFYKRIEAKNGRVNYKTQTFGQRVVELYRAGTIDRKTARKYWAIVNLRNEVTHTGRSLTDQEKRLVKSYAR